MKKTMDELLEMMRERVSEIEASRAEDLPEDIAAYLRWQEELAALRGRLARVAEDAAVDSAA